MSKAWLKDLGISYSLFLGLLVHESKLDPNAISPAGAVGIGQIMPASAKKQGYKAWTYKGYDSDLETYSEKLKGYYKKNPSELKEKDDRFKGELNIKMSAEHLANDLKTHRDEDPLVTLIRYNTKHSAVEFAKLQAQKALKIENKLGLTYWQIAPYLKEEGRMYPANVIAAAKIMHSPAKYGIVPVKPAN